MRVSRPLVGYKECRKFLSSGEIQVWVRTSLSLSVPYGFRSWARGFGIVVLLDYYGFAVFSSADGDVEVGFKPINRRLFEEIVEDEGSTDQFT